MTEQAIHAWPDAVFWTVWCASWGLSIWAVITFWMSVGTRRKLMLGERRSAVRFFARFFLVLVLLFIAGAGLNFIEILVWSGLDLQAPLPGDSDHPFYHLHIAAVLARAAWGNRLTRRWFAVPAKNQPSVSRQREKAAAAKWRKGPVLLLLAAAFVLGATAVRVWDVLSEPSEPLLARVNESTETPMERTAAGVPPTREIINRDRDQQSEPPIENLTGALKNGQVEILFVNGKGHSSGTVLDAFLINPTQGERRFHVQLGQPLFFRNRGVGQNMLITRLLGEDGKYWRQGDEERFVRIEAGTEMAPIVLWGYCVDFDKDNPVGTDELELASMPSHLRRAAQLIKDFERMTADLEDTESVLIVGQIALWKSQGISENRIRARLAHDPSHAEAANALLAGG